METQLWSFPASVRRGAWVLMWALTGCGGSEFSAAEENGGSGGAGAPSGGSGGATAGRGGAAGTGGSAGSSGGGAGSSGGGSGGGSSPSLLEACLAYTTATCKWQERCLGQRNYPSTDVCFDQTRHWCDDGGYGLGLPGTLVAAADFDACSALTDASDCRRSWPGCSLPTGELATGARCQSTLQCESRRCSGGGTTCGTCLPPAGAPGTACVSAADCGQESTCIDGVCLKNSLEGEPCGDDAPCESPAFASEGPVLDGRLLCVEGTCSIVGRLGEPCYSDATRVDICGYFSACSSEGTCVPVEQAKSGEPCGKFADAIRSCEIGTCTAPMEGGETVCVPRPGPGEECHPDLQNCEWSLVCTSGGRCAWPAAMSVTPCEE